MIITYLGKQFFKVQQGETVLAFNPIGKGSKAGAVSRFGSDIALSTTNHPDFNGVENLSHGDTHPFVINGPGDYESKDIFIRGFMTETELAGKSYINTIYSLTVDGISICFLGALADEKIPPEVREAIGSPDVLFVPVGGDGVLDPAAAAKVSVMLEPKIIIPMDYDDKSLKAFLKEAGEDDVTAIDKLTLKKKDLEGKDGEVVVLKN